MSGDPSRRALAILMAVSGGPPRRALAILTLLVASLCAQAAHAARPLSHFPVQVDGAVQGSPVVADVTGDGRLEIVLAAGAQVTALHANNRLVAGFPIALGSAAAGPVAAASIDGRGPVAILAVSRMGEIHLLRGDGTSWPGFPISLDAAARAGGALLDVTGDGRREVVVGDAEGRLHVYRLGPGGPVVLDGFPVDVGAEITATPALGDLGDEAPRRVILLGAGDGGLHAFLADGSRLTGFPVRTRFVISGGPAIADLDDDGVADVIFASQDYRLYAVDAAGAALPGFPIEAGYRIYGGPAVVDLNGDGFLEIAFAASDGHLHAVDRKGEALPGFPIRLPANPVGSVVAGDLYGDGQPILILATEDSALQAFDARGRTLEGWPLSLDGPPASGPTLADFVGDGFVEILIGTRDARLLAFKARQKGDGAVTLPWPTEGHDPARSGWRHPNRARYHDLSIFPESPRSTDDLEAIFRYRHLDRRPEGETVLRWFRDGSEVASLAGARTVPADMLQKEARWHFTVASEHEGTGAHLFTSPTVTIQNAPPSPPEIRILPESPKVGAVLRAEIATPSVDPDGDPIQYRYRWLRDEAAVDLPESADRVPAGMVKKGEVWRVIVQPFDGTETGGHAEAQTRILNSPPTAPVIALVPEAPAATGTLEVRIVRPSEDADDDAFVYRHRWRIDGEPAGLDPSVTALPPGSLRKHQEVAVEVSAFDGEAEGPSAAASVRVRNTPPTAPGIALSPASPRTGDDLRAVIETPAIDADDDPIRYTFEWAVDGEDAGIDGDAVDGARVQAGQRWSVKVRAHDDDGDGGEASARAEVANTPPVPPVIAIVPDDPLPEQPLRARVLVEATDRDGDEVRLRHTWTAEGREAVRGAELPGGMTRKGERWTVTVVPHDGKTEGAPARASVVIGNRPPPAPSVRIEPAEPVGGATLRAVAPLPEDPDGDPVRLRVRWTRDGEAVDALDDRLEVPGRQVRARAVWTVRIAATDGEAFSEVVSETVRVRVRPPLPPVVAVRPARPATTDALVCAVEREATHPDGDAIRLDLRWLRDGEATAYVGPRLPAEATRRGERWRCVGEVRLDAGDGAPASTGASTGAAGGAGAGDASASGLITGEPSAEVVVINSPPSAPGVAIFPETPRRGDALRCGLTHPSTDADGDPITYAFAWSVDGSPVADLDGPQLPPDRARRGQRWTCTVTPRDAVAAGPAAEATATIGNTPPSMPEVIVQPAHPVAGRDLECEVAAEAIDPDGDALTYRFRWYLDGVHQPFAPTSTAVRGRLVEAGQSWRCSASAHDGTDAGPWGASRPVRVEATSAERGVSGGSRGSPGSTDSGSTPRQTRQ